MTIFITQGRYSRDAVKGMIARPEDRAEQVGKLCQQAGGKLLAYYVTFGEYDFLVITDMPSHREAAVVSLTAAAGGGATDLRTTLAIPTSEAKDVLATAAKIAGGYKAPGT